jgi:hypothetical protein
LKVAPPSFFLSLLQSIPVAAENLPVLAAGSKTAISPNSPLLTTNRPTLGAFGARRSVVILNSSV